MKNILFYAWVVAGVVGCASNTKLSSAVRDQLSARYTGQTVALKQSMYFGDLYDDNEKWLLSPYPFSETFHIVDTKGAPIHPSGQKGIVPAGTSFVLYRLEFPDVAAMAARMLTTPRYSTWVYLKPLDQAGILPHDRNYFIMVLPQELDTPERVIKAIERRLGPPAEVSAWLESLKPTVKAAVLHKDVVVGMNTQEVLAAVGHPQRWLKENDRVVAWYPSREVWFDGREVSDVKAARPLSVTLQPSADVGEHPTTADTQVGSDKAAENTPENISK